WAATCSQKRSTRRERISSCTVTRTEAQNAAPRPRASRSATWRSPYSALRTRPTRSPPADALEVLDAAAHDPTRRLQPSAMFAIATRDAANAGVTFARAVSSLSCWISNPGVHDETHNLRRIRTDRPAGHGPGARG